jgi:catechol-2,3-dioxygenase
MVDLIHEEGLEIVAGPNIKPRNKAVFFRDPEGNILQFQYWIESPD